MMELKEKIDAYVARVQEIAAEYYRQNYKNLTPSTYSAEYISDKWCKIVETRAGLAGCSVHSFVALKDFATKALGQVRAGDIHKAQSWKAPAKHARGSVLTGFDEWLTNGGSVQYLR